ncbi:MAG: DUF6371 domain-containing protein [Bacteroidaceae bacterium]
MFSQTTLDRIHQIDILDVADRLGIRYTGGGTYRRCQCFMHDDRHPSMWLRATTGTWCCPVCDKGGDAVALVMAHEDMPFQQAVEWLSREFGILCTDGMRLHTSPACARRQVPCRPLPLSAPAADGPLPTLSAALPATCLRTDSPFCHALVASGILTEAQMHDAAVRYRLGRTRDGGVIFWMIDDQDRVRDGKVMFYLPTCRRNHDRPPTWVSHRMKAARMIDRQFRAVHCLFGLHLLRHAAPGGDTVVAVVESEKTAVICSALVPRATTAGSPSSAAVVWMATGGMGGLSVAALMPLRGHRVILFPDTDPDGTAYSRWLHTAQEASRALGQPITVSDLLERHSSPEQKERKIDIADLITEQT